MRDIFIGRQPICNRKLEVLAYELLYRHSEVNSAVMDDGDAASSQTIFSALMDFGLDRLVGPHKAFINLTRNVLLGESVKALPPDKVVLEILEDIEVNAPIVAAVDELSALGFRIALDDFVFDESWRPLVERADIIKLDVLALTRDELVEHVSALREYPVILLAEKVETQDCFEFCRELGFDYFQGNFFCRPKVIQGKALPSQRLGTLRLMASLSNPATTMDDVERMISQDVGLSYRLMRYINSAFFNIPQQVDSVRHALVMLGSKSIKQWATLISMYESSDKPHQLIVTAMVRARMCELLAEAHDYEGQDGYFTVGLFSLLDAMLDAPMEQALEALPLSDGIRQALLEHEGTFGDVLGCVLAFEAGAWDVVQAHDLPAETIQTAFTDAVAWVDDVERGLSEVESSDSSPVTN